MKEIAKHGEIIKAEFDIFVLKTQGVNAGLQRHNEREPGQRAIQTKISSFRPSERQYLSENRKMTLNVWRAGDDRLEAGYRELKDSKDAVKMVKQRYNFGAISPRKAKKCNRGVERGLRGAKGNVWRREYHFRSDPRRRQISSAL